MRARGYAPEECIAVGDSVEDIAWPRWSGASSWWRTRSSAARPAPANVERTEGAMGEGFYEAVVRALAESR